MSAIWAVRDSNGDLLESLTGNSPLEVGRKVVPSRYDAFRLHVSSSYREIVQPRRRAECSSASAGRSSASSD